uniref:Uncharacterized protein n=1 Tax=Rhizophora mucronata TaxID=61149 RepID=A0A2P2NNU1_RHIMU
MKFQSMAVVSIEFTSLPLIISLNVWLSVCVFAHLHLGLLQGLG